MYFTPKIMLSAVTWTKMRIAIKERLVHNHMLVYGPFTDAQVAFKLRDAFKAAQDCRHGLALCWQVKPGHSVRAGFWCNLWTSQLIATFYQGQFVDSYDPTIENTFNKTMKVKTSVSYLIWRLSYNWLTRYTGRSMKCWWWTLLARMSTVSSQPRWLTFWALFLTSSILVQRWYWWVRHGLLNRQSEELWGIPVELISQKCQNCFPRLWRWFTRSWWT